MKINIKLIPAAVLYTWILMYLSISFIRWDFDWLADMGNLDNPQRIMILVLWLFGTFAGIAFFGLVLTRMYEAIEE